MNSFFLMKVTFFTDWFMSYPDPILTGEVDVANETKACVTLVLSTVTVQRAVKTNDPVLDLGRSRRARCYTTTTTKFGRSGRMYKVHLLECYATGSTINAVIGAS